MRPKDESPEERKERKNLLKEYRKERRLEKKMNTVAFKEEAKRQEYLHKLNELLGRINNPLLGGGPELFCGLRETFQEKLDKEENVLRKPERQRLSGLRQAKDLDNREKSREASS
ncbi:hypothetical protein JTB14_014579 [Gonioctena quinquepunctata]|nr:hypothetical protein JTB14_014579 [Gonioctena quinquepunctata]